MNSMNNSPYTMNSNNNSTYPMNSNNNSPNTTLNKVIHSFIHALDSNSSKISGFF
jgi:hypothetical protein